MWIIVWITLDGVVFTIGPFDQEIRARNYIKDSPQIKGFMSITKTLNPKE